MEEIKVPPNEGMPQQQHHHMSHHPLDNSRQMYSNQATPVNHNNHATIPPPNQVGPFMMPDPRLATYSTLRDAHPSLYTQHYQNIPPHAMAHTLHLAHHFMHEENNSPAWPHQIFGDNEDNSNNQEHRQETNNCQEMQHEQPQERHVNQTAEQIPTEQPNPIVVSREPSIEVPPEKKHKSISDGPKKKRKEKKKGPHLSDLDRARVIALKEVGWTYPSIAAHVGCSATTCKNVWSKFVRDGSHKKAKRKAKPRRTNEQEDEAIVRAATQNPNKTAEAIVNELNLNICARTVRRRLNKSGLFNRMSSVKDHLTVNHMRTRVKFANNYCDTRVYNTTFWKRVVFADEKTFNVGKNGKIKVLRPRCTNSDSGNQKYRRAGQIMVNIFGCFNGDGFGQLHELPAKFGSEEYISVLRNKVIPGLRMKYPQPLHVYYVQDKFPVHTSSVVSSFFRSLDNFTVINLPPKGSDMNPIEEVWTKMKKKMTGDANWTARDLLMATYSAWEWCCNNGGYFEQLSCSMQERVMSVIASEGRWAKY